MKTRDYCYVNFADKVPSGHFLHSNMENGPVEIVDFPSYKMVIFHSYVSLPEGDLYAQW